MPKGNILRGGWGRILKQNHPKMFFLQVRHPIQRVISNWKRIFSDKKMRNTAVTSANKILAKQNKALEIQESDISLSNWARILSENKLDKVDDIDNIAGLDHFQTYSDSCHPCQYPYEFIIHYETFREDFQES